MILQFGRCGVGIGVTIAAKAGDEVRVGGGV